MARLTKTTQNLIRRKHRIRKSIHGDLARPRLSVVISNIHVSAQIIDDTKHKTLVQASTIGHKFKDETMTDKAVWVGEAIGKKAKAAKIKSVVFDRNGKLYHGRVKALADAAREQGLEF